MQTEGHMGKIMNELVTACRIKAVRNADPSYSIIDSQSVKTTSAAEKKALMAEKNKGS